MTSDRTTGFLLRRERMLAWTCGALIFLLFCTTIGSIGATVLALNTRNDTAERSTNRINGLHRDLASARSEIAVLREQNATANVKLDAIAEQVRRMGVDPIVVLPSPDPTATTPTGTTTTTRPSSPSPTTTAPQPSPPTTQPQPAPEPEPSPNPQPQPEPEPQPAFPCRTVFVPILCSEGTTNRKARP